MTRYALLLSLVLAGAMAATAQPSVQFTPDSLTRALWHFNESAGVLVSDSASTNSGTAYGTSVVPGRFGNARSFNGSGDYVNFPSSTAFDFDTAGFSVDVWFKTTQPSGILLRRGLTPDPGFMISTLNGHIVGMIGTTPGSYPDALLSDSSTATYNDGNWHLATLVRDRVLRKLLLYVDGALTGTPAVDNFTIPLNSARPLTIGRWESSVSPSFYAGTIDEVRIRRVNPAPTPATISVRPAVLDFSWVPVHSSDTLLLQIQNLGTEDSLHVTSLVADNPVFGTAAGPLVVAPGGSRTLPVWYSPVVAKVIGDTTVLRIASDDAANPIVRVTLYGFGYAPNPPTAAFAADSLTRALWHFDESSGALVHDTAAGLDGTANGTTIVPGRFGNARAFNGVSDYVTVPSNTSFDFDTASFTVDVWFRTTQLNGVILRRGLAPEPGFMISTLNGHVVGMIGNRNDLPGPNALLSDTSIAAYADNLWHLATMVRNRTLRKLFLFVDGVNACNPADDNFTIPLNSDRPLTIGEWENPDHAFFAGSIDEVRLSSPRLVRFPVKIEVQPGLLDFGTVRAFARDTVGLQVTNAGYRDSLRVTAISSSNPRFTVPPGPFAVRTGSTVVVPVVYAPTGSQVDTGTITLACNDPSSPTLSVPVSGRGFAPLDNPVITSIKRISYNQLRIVWIRSRFDTLIANPVEQYSIWRLIPLTGSTTPAIAQGGARPDSVLSHGSAWEFIQAVPAIGVDFYAYVMPSPTDYTGGNAWDVYEVVAQTRDLAAYASPTDSIAGLNVTGATGKAGTQIPGALTLNQNYPNPFNPSTTIRYGLPARSVVSLIVYNVLGQAVALLVDGEQESGYHEVRFDGSKLASGVYLCRLQAGSDVQTRKLLLLK